MSYVVNLNASNPAAPAGAQNVHFRTDATHLGTEADPLPVSAYLAPFTPDSGTGGASGLVPAPAAGDAAAGKVLNANGTWSAPAGGSGGGGGIYPSLSPPVSSNFSWVNGLTTTVTDNSDRMTVSLSPTDDDPNWRLFIANAALPSPPFSLVIAFNMMDFGGNYYGMSIGLRNSSSGKFADYSLTSNNGANLRVIFFNSVSSVSNIFPLLTGAAFSSVPLTFLKITDTGTTRTYWLSTNGKDWRPMQTEASGTFLAPDQAYIGFSNYQQSPFRIIAVYHWQMANLII